MKPTLACKNFDTFLILMNYKRTSFSRTVFLTYCLLYLPYLAYLDVES